MRTILLLASATALLTACSTKEAMEPKPLFALGAATGQIESVCRSQKLGYVYRDVDFLVRTGALAFDGLDAGVIVGRYSILQKLSAKEYKRIHLYVGPENTVIAIRTHPENLP